MELCNKILRRPHVGEQGLVDHRGRINISTYGELTYASISELQ